MKQWRKSHLLEGEKALLCRLACEEMAKPLLYREGIPVHRLIVHVSAMQTVERRLMQLANWMDISSEWVGGMTYRVYHYVKREEAEEMHKRFRQRYRAWQVAGQPGYLIDFHPALSKCEETTCSP